MSRTSTSTKQALQLSYPAHTADVSDAAGPTDLDEHAVQAARRRAALSALRICTTHSACSQRHHCCSSFRTVLSTSPHR